MLTEVRIEYFEPDEVILEQGRTSHESLYVVESGFVRLLDTETLRLVEEHGEGGVFGSYGLLRDGALPYEARAVEPTVCVLVRAGHFRELYGANKDFAAFFDNELNLYTRSRTIPFDASSARLLFGTRLGSLVHRPPVICPPEATAREVARLMRRESADSVVVLRDGKMVGLLTDIDLRNKLVAEGAPFETPVGRLMSERVVRLRAGATVFDALMAMLRERAFHVIVDDDRGGARPTLLGVVSDVGISRTQGNSPTFLLERVEQARGPSELARLRSEATGLLVELSRQGVRPGDLVTINTETNDRIMRRALSLVEAGLRRDRPDLAVDLPWAWMSLGSEGRGEMGLITDQDNALVYADPATPKEAERAEAWFRTLSERANLALAECGFALCKGDVMARNPKWRKPLEGWKKTFRDWVLDTEPQALMEAGIFFDLRGLYGTLTLVDEIKGTIAAALEEERRFLPFLARNALAGRSSPSFFRRFLTDRTGERGAINLKRRGLRPLVDIVRLLAMQAGYLDSANTSDRLRHARNALPEMSRIAESALDAHDYLTELRMARHLQAIERGEEPENRIDPSTLSRTQQSMLGAVFSTIEGVQNEVAHRYGVAP